MPLELPLAPPLEPLLGLLLELQSEQNSYPQLKKSKQLLQWNGGHTGIVELVRRIGGSRHQGQEVSLVWRNVIDHKVHNRSGRSNIPAEMKVRFLIHSRRCSFTSPCSRYLNSC